MDDLKINETLSIPADELEWTFSPSGGPGGQHANRASTRAELRFDPSTSRALDEVTRRKLLATVGTGAVMSVTVDETRSQWRNRQIAARRLAQQIREALEPEPPRRRATGPSRAARRRRADAKRARSQTKTLRRSPGPED